MRRERIKPLRIDTASYSELFRTKTVGSETLQFWRGLEDTTDSEMAPKKAIVSLWYDVQTGMFIGCSAFQQVLLDATARFLRRYGGATLLCKVLRTNEVRAFRRQSSGTVLLS
jgi:hypothetical protein